MKKQLKGCHFLSGVEVIAAAETWLDGQPSEYFFEWPAKVKSLVAVACFLPGRANDLSAPRLFWPYLWVYKAKVKVNVKFTLDEAANAQRRGRGYSPTVSLTSTLDGCRLSAPRPGSFTPGKESLCPLYWRLNGPQDRSGRVR